MNNRDHLVNLHCFNRKMGLKFENSLSTTDNNNNNNNNERSLMLSYEKDPKKTLTTDNKAVQTDQQDMIKAIKTAVLERIEQYKEASKQDGCIDKNLSPLLMKLQRENEALKIQANSLKDKLDTCERRMRKRRGSNLQNTSDAHRNKTSSDIVKPDNVHRQPPLFIPPPMPSPLYSPLSYMPPGYPRQHLPPPLQTGPQLVYQQPFHPIPSPEQYQSFMGNQFNHDSPFLPRPPGPFDNFARYPSPITPLTASIERLPLSLPSRDVSMKENVNSNCTVPNVQNHLSRNKTDKSETVALRPLMPFASIQDVGNENIHRTNNDISQFPISSPSKASQKHSLPSNYISPLSLGPPRLPRDHVSPLLLGSPPHNILNQNFLGPPNISVFKLPRIKTNISASPNGIVLTWDYIEFHQANPVQHIVAFYHLFAIQVKNLKQIPPPVIKDWKKIGVVDALPLPMACTLTQFATGKVYHFAVLPVDGLGREGEISNPCVIQLSPNI